MNSVTNTLKFPNGKINHVKFKENAHENFYNEKLRQVRHPDVYYKALIYLLGMTEGTRAHFEQIYDAGTGCIAPACLCQSWPTNGEKKLIRLSFNLYTGRILNLKEGCNEEEKLDEYSRYSVNEIFSCDYAPYFWESIKLRYPEYMGK